MKVSGFTIVRNAIKYDYPIVEAILSILPIVDEFIVSVGNSDDQTLNLIKSIPSEKIKIIESVWNDELREGGKVLAIETNKAMDAISNDSDWAFYIQADEVIHEKFHPVILDGLKKNLHYKEIDGLLFQYLHFYGSYKYIGNSRKWYRNEIRIVRNNKKIRSYKDAQGFRMENQKLKVKLLDAYVYHYGWVKNPYHQQEKQKSFHKMWHDDDWMKKNVSVADEFDYTMIDSLENFSGTHPAVLHERLKKMNWNFEFNPKNRKLSAKDRLLVLIEKITGWRAGEYKNYKLIK